MNTYMASLAVFDWEEAAQALGFSDAINLPIGAKTFANLLAGTRYGTENRTRSHVNAAYEVALVVKNNYGHVLGEPVSHSRPLAQPKAEKEPCFRLKTWLEAMSAHLDANRVLVSG